MKKLAAFLLILILAHAVSGAEEATRLQNVESQLLSTFCDGVSNGKACDVPGEWSEYFKGVCCGGMCNAWAKDCKQTVDVGGEYPSLMDVLLRAPCEDKDTGDKCVMPQRIKRDYPSVYGTCCDGKCLYWADGCDGGYAPQQEENRNVEKELEALTTLACMGVADGEKCQIGDKQLVEVVNLYGVCCGGKCMWRSASCPEVEENTKPDLVIVDMVLQPEDLSNTTTIEKVTLTIKNQGNAPAGNFWVEFRKGDDSAPLIRDIGSLDASKETRVVFEGISPYTQPNTRYKIEARVDANPNSLRDNLVDESDEENNRVTVEVYVGEPKAVDIEDRLPVCGDNRCDEGEDCPEDCKEKKEGTPWQLILGGIALLFLAAAAVYFFTRRKSGGVDYELQIARLTREKKMIEEMIELAKAKYHRRKLDEESFKEIFKENQKKLIEIETRINELETWVKASGKK